MRCRQEQQTMSDWLDAEAHADRALEMYERGRWAEAEAELRKAISLNPDQAEWHFNLGLTLEQAGRDSDALTSYERAIELLPAQPDPLVAAGVVANRLDLCEKAIVLFEQALRLDPMLESAYAHKIESHLRLGHHDEAETTFYLAQQALAEPSAQCLAVMAESLMQRGLYERAEWCLKEAMRLEPGMPRLRARLAAVSAATGRPQRALQLYLRELRDDPGNIDTLLEYGELLTDLGRLPEAAEKFRRILELEPANVDAHFGLGQIAMASRRYEQANLEFELVMKLDNQYPDVRVVMGETLLRRGEVEAAKPLLLEEFEAIKGGAASDPGASLSVDDKTRSHLIRVAQLLLEAEEAAAAADLLELAVAQEKSADLLRMLALARFRAGDRNAGSAASRRVLRLDASCVRSIHNLALAALEQRQHRMAAGWIKRGLQLNRHDTGLRRLRMRVWLALLQQWWGRLVTRPRRSPAVTKR
jgi:tetratricopeptide (TPR) repeat protein